MQLRAFFFTWAFCDRLVAKGFPSWPWCRQSRCWSQCTLSQSDPDLRGICKSFPISWVSSGSCLKKRVSLYSEWHNDYWPIFTPLCQEKRTSLALIWILSPGWVWSNTWPEIWGWAFAIITIIIIILPSIIYISSPLSSPTLSSPLSSPTLSSPSSPSVAHQWSAAPFSPLLCSPPCCWCFSQPDLSRVAWLHMSGSRSWSSG